MIENKLIKNGSYYVIGTILLQGINFFSLPLFTRILTTESFGMVSIYNTWVSIFTIFISLQVAGSVGIAKMNFSENEFKAYKSNIFLLLCILFIFWNGIFLLSKNFILNIFNLNFLILISVVFQSFFFSIITFVSNEFTFEEQPRKKLLLSFVNVLTNISLSIFLIKKLNESEGYYGRIFGSLIPVCTIGLYFIIKVFIKRWPKININHWKFCLSLTLPLIFHNLSNIILASSDKIILEKYKGLTETGIYSFSYTLGTVISILWVALNNAWVPWYYKKIKNEEHTIIKKYSENYLKFFTGICVVFIICAPEMIKIMAPSRYNNGLYILPLVVLGYFFTFLYSFSVNYEFYNKKTKYIGIATTIAALINVVLNLYFIPIYSGIGAAATTAISYLFMFIFHETITRKILNYRILKYKDYMYQTLIMALTVTIYYNFLDNIKIRYFILMIYIATLAIDFYNKNKRVN